MKYDGASGIGSDSPVKFNNFTDGHSTIPKSNNRELDKNSLFAFVEGERGNGAAQWRNEVVGLDVKA